MLNVKDCVTAGGNTGISDCDFNPQNIIGLFLVPTNRVYSTAETATVQTMVAALQADSVAGRRNRVFPIKNIAGFTDNTEDATVETLSYGTPITIREGQYNLNLRFLKGGLCLSNALRKFNNSSVSVLLIDSAGTLIGARQGENLIGIPLNQFYARPLKLNDGSGAVVNYSMDISFNPNYLNEDIGFLVGNVTDWNSVNGLQDVVLKEIAGSAKPILKLVVQTGCGGESILDDDAFATELADVALWKATNVATKADIDITSVVISNSVATVTVDGADTDYGTFTIELASASDLFTAGVEGFESKPLTIVVP